MKAGWKDYLNVQQSDKTAVILLLILIVLSGGVAIFLNYTSKDNSFHNEEKSRLLFDNFQNSLIEADEQTIAESTAGIQTGNKTAVSTKLETGEKININAADIASLKRIPGIGDEYARRISQYRSQLGGFVSTQQLTEIQGISQNRHDKIVPYIFIEGKPQQLNINILSFEQLSAHPYIDEKQAQSIVEFRNQKGRISSLKELLDGRFFSSRDLDRLSGYVNFD